MTMTKRITAILVMAFAFAALGFAANARADVAIPEGYVLIGDHCNDWTLYNEADKVDTTGDPDTVEYTAPEGKYVVAYCVKAGTEAYEYTTTGTPTSVTIDHPMKDSISHYQVVLGTLPKTDPEPPAEDPTVEVGSTVDVCTNGVDVDGASITVTLDPKDFDQDITVYLKGESYSNGYEVTYISPDGTETGSKKSDATPIMVVTVGSEPVSVTVPVETGWEFYNVAFDPKAAKDILGRDVGVTIDPVECPVQPEPEYRTDTDEESYCSADGIRTIKTSGQDLIREYVWGDGEWVLGEWEPVNSWALISEETVEDEACAIAPEPEPDEPTLAETGTPEMMGWLAAIASFLTITGAVGVALRRIG